MTTRETVLARIRAALADVPADETPARTSTVPRALREPAGAASGRTRSGCSPNASPTTGPP